MFIRKKRFIGAPGWLSRLSVQLHCGAGHEPQDHELPVPQDQALSGALCWVWGLGFSLSLSLPLPHSLMLSLSFSLSLKKREY